MLLDKHYDSMLARIASELWQEDPEAEAEIFIEGNGFRFQYILDYMRHDILTLPRTESRDMIIAELEYYGIVVNEKNIVDSMVDVMKTLQRDDCRRGMGELVRLVRLYWEDE